MKYLVLGSAGQIGSALCDYLKEAGHTVRTFDIAVDDSEDLRHPNKKLDKRVKDCDFVFFLAFDVGGSSYLKTYQHTYDFIDNNARIMVFTFEYLKKHKKPFIFASSQMSNMAFSTYGTSKALGEFYTKSLGGIIIKLWNVYGVEHDPRKTHVITDFVKMAIGEKMIKMRTNGKEERQFLHTRDCCEALLILAKRYNKIPRDKELHITSFKWEKVAQVAKEISALCDGVKIIPGKEKDTVQRGKRNEPDPYILSIWKPKTSLRHGVKEIVKHHIRHHKGKK
jgi:nucleoside-diphosphate-sugar epimerase